MRISARSLATTLSILAAATFVAAGCGTGDDGRSGGTSAVTGADGAFGWLPEDTWLVSGANLSADHLQDAIDTLARLPIWSLAKSSLPADDGAGIRGELLTQVAKAAPKQAKLTRTRLEAAFGDHVGLAITSTDLAKLRGGEDGTGDDQAPLAIFVDVDDEDAARAVASDIADGTETEREHEGVSFTTSTSSKEPIAWTIQEGLLVVTSTRGEMERLIDAHEGNSLADGDEAAAVVDAGIGDAFAGVAIGSRPLLDAAEQLAKDGTELSDAQAKRLGDVLGSDAVEDLVPAWTSGSIDIDDVGVRVRGSWSGPHEIAKPQVGSRELIERFPADAPMASASVMSGDELGRVQAVWSEVGEGYDLDIRDLRATCPAAYLWACDLGIESLVVALEDDELASAMHDAGPIVTGYTQSFDALLANASLGTSAAGAPPARAVAPSSRWVEIAGTDAQVDYTPPKALTDAAAAAGLAITSTDGGHSATIEVVPTSPLGELLAKLTPAQRAGLTGLGIDVKALLGTGITIEAEVVDDLLVTGFPSSAPSKLAPALRGDVDTIGKSARYEAAVDAADPPEEVGAYGYVDVQGLVETIFGAVAKSTPQAKQLLPTVQNNLKDIPGVLTWTARDEVDGEQVGTFDLVVPITK